MIIPARYKVDVRGRRPRRGIGQARGAHSAGTVPRRCRRAVPCSSAPCWTRTPPQLEDMRTSKNKEDQEAFAAAAAEFDSLNKLGAAKFAAHTHEIVRLDLSGPAELTGAMTQSLARAEADAAALRKLSDRRIKFSTATRIILRLIFLFRHYGDVAGKINHSKKHGAKWLAQHRQGRVARPVHLAHGLPQLPVRFRRLDEKARERQERGLDAPPVDSKFQRPGPQIGFELPGTEAGGRRNQSRRHRPQDRRPAAADGKAAGQSALSRPYRGAHGSPNSGAPRLRARIRPRGHRRAHQRFHFLAGRGDARRLGNPSPTHGDQHVPGHIAPVGDGLPDRKRRKGREPRTRRNRPPPTRTTPRRRPRCTSNSSAILPRWRWPRIRAGTTMGNTPA